MINATRLPHSLTQCPPMHRQTFGIIFSIHQYKKWKTRPGLPSGGGTSPSPPAWRTLGGGGAGVNEPVHWADLFTDPYRLYTQRLKHTAQTRLLSRQQKQLIHVFVLSHFPLAWAQSAPDSICGAALLLCFQPWKLYKYLLAQEPLHQAKAINTRKKAKESHLTHLAIIMIIMWWYNI